MNESIDDLPLFLAHALALERESAERYRELASSMEEHNSQCSDSVNDSDRHVDV